MKLITILATTSIIFLSGCQSETLPSADTQIIPAEPATQAPPVPFSRGPNGPPHVKGPSSPPPSSPPPQAFVPPPQSVTETEQGAFSLQTVN